MGQMKRLAVDLEEYQDEIEEVFEEMRKETPHIHALVMNEGVSHSAKQTALRLYTKDEKLVELAILSIKLKSS